MTQVFSSQTYELETEKKRKYVGQPHRRREALRLVTGNGQFVDDTRLPEKVYHLKFVRSPFAHARINSVDYSEALKLEGVIGAFSGKDLADVRLPYITHLTREPAKFPLAVDEARFCGEAIAAVVAEDKYVAEDAIQLVDVDYDATTAVVDPLQALKDTDHRVYEEFPDNVAYHASYQSSADVLARIQACPLVVDEVFANGRTSPLPLEPRSVMARFDGDKLTIWASSQSPHILRSFVAEALHLPDEKVHVLTPNVGGAFGAKLDVYEDEIAVYAIALRLKVPIKWIETQTEHLMLVAHERDQVHSVKVGFTGGGKIVGIHDKIVGDLGVGGTFWGSILPLIRAPRMLTGQYKVSNYAYESFGVWTNKPHQGANVGFGKPVAAFVMERVLDIAAKRLKIDPAEIRRMNLVHSDEFPYRNAAGDVYDSGNYTKGFEMLLETMNYDKLRKEQGELRRKGVFLGIGLAGYVENTAASSKAMYSTDVAGYEKAVVRIDPTGHVVALVGTSDSGQGHLTAFAQIVADELGVNIDDVDVVEGDTALTPYGFGSWVSRSIITSGNALIIACQKLRSKVKRIAAFLLHVPEDGLTISEGVVRATGGDKGKEIPLAALAKIAYRMPGRLPHDEDPQLEEFGIFDPPGDRTIMSYGWHGAVIEVDPEMGSFEVKKYYVIHDAGVIVNPAGADGQFYGGVISQGMLQTFSELKYDRDGILLTTSLNDYIPPTSLVVPEEFKIGHLVTPGPGPGGFKGLSEGGVTGAPAAFVNAIADAISPLTSSELKRVPVSWDDVWNAIPHDRAMHISES